MTSIVERTSTNVSRSLDVSNARTEAVPANTGFIMLDAPIPIASLVDRDVQK
jgi:hypothetical protein